MLIIGYFLDAAGRRHTARCGGALTTTAMSLDTAVEEVGVGRRGVTTSSACSPTQALAAVAATCTNTPVLVVDDSQ